MNKFLLGKQNRKPRQYRPEHDDIVYQMCLLGATDPHICGAIGIGMATLHRWKKAHKGFRDAIKRGKDQADAEVAHSLYKKACGYEHEDVHIAVLKDRRTGLIEKVLTPITKHYAPDTTACIFWLKNRQKDLWRDVNRTEHTGKDGKPIEKQLRLDLSSLTDAELATAESLGLKLTKAALAADEEEELPRPLRVRGTGTIQ